MVLLRQRVGGVLCQSGQSQGENLVSWSPPFCLSKTFRCISQPHRRDLSEEWSLKLHI